MSKKSLSSKTKEVPKGPLKDAEVDVPFYDIVISGGGVVGCLMALALAKHSQYKVLLLEANLPTPTLDSSSSASSEHLSARFDARVIALASESLHLLSSLGVDINQVPYQAITQIHVSDKGHLGQVRLHANDYDLDALGKVVAIDALGEYLLTRVKVNSQQITYAAPLKVEQVEQTPEYANIVLSNSTLLSSKRVKTKLLIVSDGGQSTTASLAGMKSRVEEYGQTAIITNVKTQLAHNNIAYERFTSQGPIAFLPMNTCGALKQSKQHSMSVVWCMHEQGVQSTLALSEGGFLQRLGTLFGDKLGKLTSCSQRYTYPLRLVQSEPFVMHRAIAIGNASQSLHPIAGQGFNLGIRDVEGLLSALKDAADPGSFEVVNQYKKARQSDKQATIAATDALVSIFSNQYFPLVAGRNLALLGMNKSGILKQQFAKFAMGLRKTHD
ncbi:MAG: 2-octaprenyl-6-methoxyphenol hydroxylase [Alphaproteobacteria bacterium]